MLKPILHSSHVTIKGVYFFNQKIKCRFIQTNINRLLQRDIKCKVARMVVTFYKRYDVCNIFLKSSPFLFIFNLSFSCSKSTFTFLRQWISRLALSAMSMTTTANTNTFKPVFTKRIIIRVM